jgi:hypothetical protein
MKKEILRAAIVFNMIGLTISKNYIGDWTIFVFGPIILLLTFVYQKKFGTNKSQLTVLIIFFFLLIVYCIFYYFSFNNGKLL